MESSTAEFLKRQFAFEQLPTSVCASAAVPMLCLSGCSWPLSNTMHLHTAKVLEFTKSWPVKQLIVGVETPQKLRDSH
jgi:hypothetical protein